MSNKPLKQEKLSTFYSDALDWQIFRASQLPAPGEYYSDKLVLPEGGTFSKFTAASYVDASIKKAKSMPGPADYPPPVPPKPSGGKFNMSKPKSDIDWIITRASQMPGPGDTDPGPPPKVTGGKFNTGKSKSDVEWRIYRAAQIPGPADYPPVPLPKPTGGKFNLSKPKTDLEWIETRSRQLPGPGQYDMTGMQKMSGGKFNMSNAKSDIDWLVYKAARLPGPGQYEVDHSIKYLMQSPAARLCGRTGPKNMPWPFNGKKNREEPVATTAASPSTKSIPPEARGVPKKLVKLSRPHSQEGERGSMFITQDASAAAKSEGRSKSVAALNSSGSPTKLKSLEKTPKHKPTIMRPVSPGAPPPHTHSPDAKKLRSEGSKASVPANRSEGGFHPLAEDPAAPLHRKQVKGHLQ